MYVYLINYITHYNNIGIVKLHFDILNLRICLIFIINVLFSLDYTIYIYIIYYYIYEYVFFLK